MATIYTTKLGTFNWKLNLDADFMLFTEVSVKTAASFLMAGVMKIAGRFSRLVFTLTFSVRHLNAIKSTAGRSFLGIKPLPALQQM
jgi:hypothetical protein